MIFVLEDDMNRVKWFEKYWPTMFHTASPKEAIEFLRSNPELDIIFLDHDLGGGFNMRGPEGDGIDLAQQMAEEGLHLGTKIIIHSLNPAGARNILNALDGYQDVSLMSFIKLRQTVGE